LSAFITADLNGVPRPLDGNRDGVPGFDLGAYEFNPLFFTSITIAGPTLRLCWFDALPGMQLQAASSLANPVWTNVPLAPGATCVDVPNERGAGYYRLVQP